MAIDWGKYDFPERPQPEKFHPLFPAVCDYLRECYGGTWTNDYFCNFIEMIAVIRKKFKSLSYTDIADFSWQLGRVSWVGDIHGNLKKKPIVFEEQLDVVPSREVDGLTLLGCVAQQGFVVPAVMCVRYCEMLAMKEVKERPWHPHVVKRFYEWHIGEKKYDNLSEFIETILNEIGLEDDQVVRDFIDRIPKLSYTLELLKAKPEYRNRKRKR